jgi:hypothetical protein
LDENIRRLLERFDATTSTDENNQSSPSSTLTNDGNNSNPNPLNTTNSNSNNERQGEEIRSYIRQLNTWLREDLDGHLKQRLDFSTKAIVKLVRVFDNLTDKYQRLFTSINSSSSTGESNSIPACTNEVYKSVLERNLDLERENDRIQRLNTSLQSRIHEITLRVNIQMNPFIFKPILFEINLVFRFKQSISSSRRTITRKQKSFI